jgi:hypothetical protein
MAGEVIHMNFPFQNLVTGNKSRLHDLEWHLEIQNIEGRKKGMQLQKKKRNPVRLPQAKIGSPS